MSKQKRVPKFVRVMQARRRPPPSSKVAVVEPGQADIGAEVKHICRLAAQEECRVIGLGKLVFFSTFTRDAWMLDWEDELAICLMDDGVEQPFELSEDERQAVIRWQGRYHIEGPSFMFIANDTPTHARIIQGYPTEVILHTVEQMRRGM